MKLISLLIFLCLNNTLFSVSDKTFSQKPKKIVVYDKQIHIDESPQDQILQIEPHQALIIGRWRGYQETPDFVIYYGYEFRPNGVYVARHRVYQQNKTILDRYLQGKWSFDGKVLSLEGTVTKGNSTIFNYSFNLVGDNLLQYQDGDLPAPYFPGKMGKIG